MSHLLSHHKLENIQDTPRDQVSQILGASHTQTHEAIRAYVISDFFQTIPDSIHNLRITRASIPILPSEHEQLAKIAGAIPDFLNGLGRMAALSLVDDKSRRINKAYRLIRQALHMNKNYDDKMKDHKRDASRKELQIDTEAENAALDVEISHEHPFCRIDLVKGTDGNFYIAEIEVDKMHGFGYGSLSRELAVAPVGIGLVEHMTQLTAQALTVLVVPELERFYLPELRFFAKRVNESGGRLFIATEGQIVATEDGIYLKGYGNNQTRIQQVLTSPHFQGAKAEQLQKHFSAQVSAGTIKVLSQPFKGLGEKATLGLISNLSEDVHLEKVLALTIGESSLALLRKHIPPTECVSSIYKHRRNIVIKAVTTNPEDYFVKTVNESGARGIAKPGDSRKQLELILGKAKMVVVQKAVSSHTIKLPFCDIRSGEEGEDNFTIRYSLFVSSQGDILDLALTGSPGVVAHGGQKSILMGATLIA